MAWWLEFGTRLDCDKARPGQNDVALPSTWCRPRIARIDANGTKEITSIRVSFALFAGNIRRTSAVTGQNCRVEFPRRR